MANYQTAHPALPPLVSGVNDSPAVEIADGAPLNDGDIEAARRQTKRRRALFEATNRRATEDEVQQAVKREFCVVAENATGVVAGPPWAIQLRNDLRNELREFRNELGNEFRNDLRNELHNIRARLVNLSTTEAEDTIELLRNAANALPPAPLPATRLELDNLPNARVVNLLAFYGLANAPVATQRRRLKRFLGVK
mmetsp:Transcript_8167/g.12624  ORF Transcript_8167/g.12624 Transcript_8167/m.12624 type:complete len:196 (+) Transcript_8167:246-833(+)